MPLIIVNGMKFYGNPVPVKGMKRDERRREIRRRIDDKEWIPWQDRPKAPRKPNPHKGQKCALWVNKNEQIVRPPGIEASVQPKIPPKPQPRPPRPTPPIPPKPPIYRKYKAKHGNPTSRKMMSTAQFAVHWRKSKGLPTKMAPWTQEMRDDYKAYVARHKK